MSRTQSGRTSIVLPSWVGALALTSALVATPPSAQQATSARREVRTAPVERTKAAAPRIEQEPPVSPPLVVVDPPALAPGRRLEFVTPSRIVGREEGDGSSISGIVIPVIQQVQVKASQTGTVSQRKQSTITASNDFSIPKARRFQSADFPTPVDLEGRFDPETPIRSQVSGELDLRGFLAVLGVGQAHVEVRVAVDDLGTDLIDDADDQVVTCRVVTRHDLVTSLDPSLGWDLSVQGGAAFAGAGVSVGARLGTSLQKEVVREEVEFGFEAMLQRGHTYRVSVVLDVAADIAQTGLGLGAGVTDARAIASFSDAGDDVPILFNEFFSAFQSAEDGGFAVPNMTLGDLEFTLPEFETSIDTFGGVMVPVQMAFLQQPFVDANQVLEAFGFDTGMNGMSDIEKVRVFANEFIAASAMETRVEEDVDDRGLTRKSVAVLLDADLVEMTDRIERRAIEEQLDRCTRMTDLRLSVDQNGRFEVARDVMVQLYEAAKAMGFDATCTDAAKAQIMDADADVLAGDFNAAFRCLCDAYHALKGCS